jgi:hypothetical protein
MSDLLTKDLINYDPLSDITRRERRSLLGLSVVAIATVKVPILPEKISALGIDFSLKNQQTFLSIFALVLAYYLAAFLIYAMTDYIAWRRSKVITQHEYTRQKLSSSIALGKEAEKMLIEELAKDKEMSYRGFASYSAAVHASRLRAIFEFFVPIAVSAYASWNLVSYGRP